MESFLVALAMAVLKYYGPIIGVEIEKVWNEHKELEKNKDKVKSYEKIAQDPTKNRAERRHAEDSLLE